MNHIGTPTSSSRAVIDRLLKATNEHDLDCLIGCFARDYVNETPVHPLRGFSGSDQVRLNWRQIFGAVPDLVAEVVGLIEVTGSADNEGTVWTEWQMSGARVDGTAHLMRGVIIFSVKDDWISAARFYLEPVETSSGDVNAAVRAQMASRPRFSSPAEQVVSDAWSSTDWYESESVRVLTRDPVAASHLVHSGVELVTGDVRDPSSLGPAMSGVGTVVSAVHGLVGSGGVTPESVDRGGNRNLIEAAAVAIPPADVVLVSTVHASADHPMELFRMKWAAEEQLWASGLRWTIVRSNAFVETWVEPCVRPPGPQGDHGCSGAATTRSTSYR